MPKLTVVQPRNVPDGTAIETMLAQDADKDLLRFLTCGSVGDGKSTLVGRLLYDSQLIHEDEIAAIEPGPGRSRKSFDELDFSLLVDGLQAEREQGITIDVAYRYFAGPKRKFVVADTP
ncbi:MAG: GTP-binding protein, partial [Methyloligellaceae bacterium]